MSRQRAICYTEGFTILTLVTGSVRPPGMPFTYLERAIEPQAYCEELISLVVGLTDVGLGVMPTSMMVSPCGGSISLGSSRSGGRARCA